MYKRRSKGEKRMKKRKETRLTVVSEKGRVCEIWDVEIFEDVQDNGRTLKLFLSDKSSKKAKAALNRLRGYR